MQTILTIPLQSGIPLQSQRNSWTKRPGNIEPGRGTGKPHQRHSSVQALTGQHHACMVTTWRKSTRNNCTSHVPDHPLSPCINGSCPDRHTGTTNTNTACNHRNPVNPLSKFHRNGRARRPGNKEAIHWPRLLTPVNTTHNTEHRGYLQSGQSQCNLEISAQLMHGTAGEYRTRAKLRQRTTQGRYTTQSKGQFAFPKPMPQWTMSMRIRPAKDKTQSIDSKDRNPSTGPCNQNHLKT